MRGRGREAGSGGEEGECEGKRSKKKGSPNSKPKNIYILNVDASERGKKVMRVCLNLNLVS